MSVFHLRGAPLRDTPCVLRSQVHRCSHISPLRLTQEESILVELVPQTTSYPSKRRKVTGMASWTVTHTASWTSSDILLSGHKLVSKSKQESLTGGASKASFPILPDHMCMCAPPLCSAGCPGNPTLALLGFCEPPAHCNCTISYLQSVGPG